LGWSSQDLFNHWSIELIIEDILGVYMKRETYAWIIIFVVVSFTIAILLNLARHRYATMTIVLIGFALYDYAIWREEYG
jgi:hypothetical protein